MIPEHVDTELHTFHSPKFQSVVEEAINFFSGTPIHLLPPASHFTGVGVYGLYYLGDSHLYDHLATTNRQECSQPIYVGKAVPPGWRTARAAQYAESYTLYSRLREHTRSLAQAADLDPTDFRTRFMILGELERDLVVPVEAELIRRHTPLWNAVVDGFGNHDPGKGRYNQARSQWDILHPGRLWADRLTGPSPRLQDIVERISRSS